MTNFYSLAESLQDDLDQLEDSIAAGCKEFSLKPSVDNLVMIAKIYRDENKYLLDKNEQMYQALVAAKKARWNFDAYYADVLVDRALESFGHKKDEKQDSDPL